MKYRLIIDPEKEEEVLVISHSANNFTAKIENIILSYNGFDEINVHNDDELVRLKISDIECITIIDRKTYVVDSNSKKYRLGQTLSEIETSLPTYFVRINKSTIANTRKLSRFKYTFNGSVDAVFNCGYTEYVSRRCFSNIKKRYGI